MDGIKNMELLSTRDFQDFDHNKRKWTSTIYTTKEIYQLLTKIEKTNPAYINSIMAPIDSTDYNKLWKSYSNFSHHKMYNVFRNLELGTKNISFFIFGNLSRDVGQVVNIQAEKTELQPDINGPWQIYSCIHTWEDNTYLNDITCYRSFAMKPIVKDKK